MKISVILEHVQDIIYVVKIDNGGPMGGKVEVVSKAVESLLGYKPQEFIENPNLWISMIHPDDIESVRQATQQMYETGKPIRRTYRIRHKTTGQYLWIQDKPSPLYDNEWRFVGCISVAGDITERKHVEQALCKSDGHFRILAETASDGIIEIDQTDTILFVNPAVERIFGHRFSDLPGKDITMLMPDYLRHIHKTAIQRYIDTKEKRLAWEGIELTGLHKNGKEIPIEISFGEFTRDGRTLFIGIVRDITERKRLEALQRQRLEELQIIYLINKSADITESLEDIYENAINAILSGLKADSASILLFDEDDVMRFKAWRGLSEEYRKAVDGHSPWTRDVKDPQPIVVEDIEHEPSLEHFRTLFEKEGLKALGFIPLLLHGHLIGKFMVYFNTQHYFEEGEIRFAQTIASNIAFAIERKKSEKNLRQSEERYRTFFEEDITADFIATVKGRLLECNPAYVRMFGFPSLEKALATNIVELHECPEQYNEHLALLRKDKNIVYHEMKLRRSDGAALYVVENLTGYFNEQGNLTQMRGYLFDDTKRKVLEQQFIQSQKLDGIGTLAAGIAHDFNNILGIIIGHASLLENLNQDKEGIARHLDAISKAAYRGANIVKQILTFARKTEVIVETLDLRILIKDCANLFYSTFPKNIILSLDVEKELPFVEMDVSQIHRVILNLCVNARDAMPKGGTLSISTDIIEGDAVISHFHKADAQHYVKLQVADTGIGMDEATRLKVFEPFFTTKGPGKGTGLGLALVYGIVKNHDGFIHVRSKLGEGTTFTVYFPAAQYMPEVSKPIIQTSKNIADGTETILLIEDEEMIMEMMQEILVSNGYRVLTAADGQQGIEMYQSHEKEIAVVLSDLGLPVINGQEVFRRIRQINPGAKIILASGYIDPELKSEMCKAGASHFIQKPYSSNEVLQKIREVLSTDG